jgi:hypothetical protein
VQVGLGSEGPRGSRVQRGGGANADGEIDGGLLVTVIDRRWMAVSRRQGAEARLEEVTEDLRRAIDVATSLRAQLPEAGLSRLGGLLELGAVQTGEPEVAAFREGYPCLAALVENGLVRHLIGGPARKCEDRAKWLVIHLERFGRAISTPSWLFRKSGSRSSVRCPAP